MCGIAGIVDPTGAPVDRGALGRMVKALTPRGPDAEGVWTAPGVGLGHRRLKVIDLSEAAAQPMANDAGTVQVVFNGEIYNFQDLRAELIGAGYRFRSRSDTEVLIHGYDAWGDGLLSRIDGMFAFGLWDGQRRRFLAARDRLGKKPFYYARIPREGAPPLFSFASELKGLLQGPAFDRAIDPQALARYLTYEYVPAPFTIFRGAQKLDAGERLVLDLEEDLRTPLELQSYWSLPFPNKHASGSDAQAAGDLKTLLRRSVARRLVADVPVGIFLSGGLDSSTIAAVACDLAGADRIKTFSIGFSEASFDESEQARLVSRHLGTDHHEDHLSPRAMLDILPEVEGFLDEPFADASIVPTYLLCRFARQHVTVALGGDGGDELFAGYPTFKAHTPGRWFFDHAPRALYRATRWASRFLPAKTDYFSLDFKVNQFLRGGPAPGPRRHQRWMASFLPEELTRLLQPDLAATIGDPLADIDVKTRSTSARHELDVLMDFYVRFYLTGDINVKVDRASGAVGLEARAPFEDTDVVGFACQIAPSLRLRGMTSKYVLRQAMRGRLPDAIIDRRKQGFGVPVARWLKGELRPALLEALSPEHLAQQGLFSPEEVKLLLDNHLSGRRDQRKALWTLFAFQRWFSRWAK